jgi:hypothetical protein
VASQSTPPNFPAWLRWSTVAWMALWVPAYWRTWGPSNFLQLCDISVILTCLGLWTDNLLLISSQAVSALLIDLVWTIDVFWRFFSGRPLLGATEYLFDARYPLWVRLLSLFHLAMPPLLLWALQRAGYDRRGIALQSLIALAVLTASRFTSPAKNMNFAFTDPFFHRAWGAPPVQVAITFLFLTVVLYLPTDLMLSRIFRRKGIA